MTSSAQPPHQSHSPQATSPPPDENVLAGPGATPFRERALAHLTRELGEPKDYPVGPGVLYRWDMTRRDGRGLRVTVSLNCPELPRVANVTVTDLAPETPSPVTSFLAYSLPQLEPVVAYIRSLAAQTAGGDGR